ncbi:MAG: hypothetical protein KKA84_09215 [Bacteroidetes bacterium]|nr:hypothetical protein [Bacteroidota bacterium]
MPKEKTKYRIITYSLLFFYANFYFISPFIHHHHSETGITQEYDESVHSHLGAESLDNLHNTEIEHSTMDESHHTHPFQIYSIKCINTPRVIRVVQSQSIHYIIFDLEITSESQSFFCINIENFSKLQWEKYVHFASNASPPLT